MISLPEMTVSLLPPNEGLLWIFNVSPFDCTTVAESGKAEPLILRLITPVV